VASTINMFSRPMIVPDWKTSNDGTQLRVPTPLTRLDLKTTSCSLNLSIASKALEIQIASTIVAY